MTYYDDITIIIFSCKEFLADLLSLASLDHLLLSGRCDRCSRPMNLRRLSKKQGGKRRPGDLKSEALEM